MESEPMVSVIIPVYNGEKTLRECLSSTLNQTYNNYEVIVVDNNSTDRTKEIISDFKKNDSKVKYVFVKIRSPGAARNEGIRLARGAILVFTDADCVCPFQWIEGITRPIRLESEDVTVGFEEDLVKNYWTKNIQKIDEIHMEYCRHGEYTVALDTKNTAMKAEVIRKMMFDPDINEAEDLDLALRITSKNRIRYLPCVKVGHFHRTSLKSTVKTYFTRAFWSAKVYGKYKKNISVRKNIMFENMRLKKWLVFPFWVLFQFMKRPFGEAYFIFVSEFSWRSGLLWAMIKK